MGGGDDSLYPDPNFLTIDCVPQRRLLKTCHRSLARVHCRCEACRWKFEPLKLQGEFVGLFLGYDPGGKGKNGVAAIRLDLETPAILATDTVLDASEALSWLSAYSESAEALGIDTLLAWSPKGRRACDDALRRRYRGNSIVAQNSLYSAMTLNGAIVARRLGLPVYESHPKLLIQTISEQPIRQLYHETIAKSGTDHEADAVVAAWCSAMGHTRNWAADLFSDIEDDIELVVPGARYPWFEAIVGS